MIIKMVAFMHLFVIVLVWCLIKNFLMPSGL